MLEVTELKLVEEPKKPLTVVWATADAEERLLKSGDFLTKLRRYATNGFKNYMGTRPKPIRPEWDGVYRIGDGNRLRAMGFFDGNDFIIIGCCKKKGKGLGAKCTNLVKKCAKIKKDKEWKRA